MHLLLGFYKYYTGCFNNFCEVHLFSFLFSPIMEFLSYMYRKLYLNLLGNDGASSHGCSDVCPVGNIASKVKFIGW